MGWAGHVDGISRSCGWDKEIPHGVLPMGQPVLSTKQVRKNHYIYATWTHFKRPYDLITRELNMEWKRIHNSIRKHIYFKSVYTIQYNFQSYNIRIRTEAPLQYVDKVQKAMTSILHNTNSRAKLTFPSSWLYLTEAKVSYNNYTWAISSILWTDTSSYVCLLL